MDLTEFGDEAAVTLELAGKVSHKVRCVLSGEKTCQPKSRNGAVAELLEKGSDESGAVP